MEPSLEQGHFLLRMENIFFVAAVVISTLMLFWPMISQRGTKEVDTRAAIKLINHQDALVLDVRDDSDYAEGHLPNSTHIPTEKIEERWVELKKFTERPILIIYSSGIRSHHSSKVLSKNGFNKVHNLMGGIDAWKRAGLPIVKR